MRYYLPLIATHHQEDGLLVRFVQRDTGETKIVMADIGPKDTTYTLPDIEGYQLMGVYQLIPLSPVPERADVT
jgi:hypothetical protein